MCCGAVQRPASSGTEVQEGGREGSHVGEAEARLELGCAKGACRGVAET